MRPVTDAWAAGVAESHQVATRITLVQDGTQFTTGISGSVALESEAATRGRLDLTLEDDGTLGLVPDDPTDSVAPYGNEIKAERGITYPGGTTEYIGLGIFRIDELEVDDSGEDLALKIVGLDRSARIIEAKFETPYQIAAGTNVATGILTTLQAAYPDIETSFVTTDLTTPLVTMQEGDDRWDKCQGIAEACGFELYFDGDGVCVLRPIASVNSTAVADLVEGESGILLSAGRRWTRQGAANRWIVTGENAGEGAIPRATATDDNPLSPTRYGGPFGSVPDFQNFSEVLTDTQAQDAANGLKAKNIGTSQQIDFGSVVNPALEPGDVVNVKRERLSVDEKHILDMVTIPLSATESMTGRTRAVVSN